MRKLLIAAMKVMAAMAAASTFPAHAQDAPSTRNATMVIPFSPGASNDIIGRFLANGLSKKWGRPVVAENKPGAGSAIGSAYVARSAPDGNTMLFMSSAYTTMVATTTARERGFDVADLQPTAMATRGQYVLVVGPSVKAKNFAEFVTEAKARSLFASTPGINSGSHFAAEAMASTVGFKMEPVHYKGGSEAAIDLMAERVDMYIGSISLNLPFIKEGKMRALAVVSADRSPLLPDVPSIVEAGYKDAEFSAWWGVFVPARTPAAVVDSLNADVNAVMGTPEARKFLEDLGNSTSPMPPAQFKAVVLDETRRWTRLAEKMKATAK